MSQSTFTLPGLQDTKASRTLIRSFIYAYSRQMNPRRLEDNFYISWGIIFTALFFDDEEILCAPQHTIYKSPANLPIDPRDANTSIRTEFGSSGDRRPDFTFIGTRLVFRESLVDVEPETFPKKFSLWSTMKIRSGGPLGFGEIKRPPTRRAPTRRLFRRGLAAYMERAKVDLESDVTLAFSEPSYKSDCYLLFAAVGEWFCFKFATREAQTESDESEPESSGSEFSFLKLDRQPKVDDQMKKKKASKFPVGEGSDFKRYRSINPDWMEKFCDDVEDAMPPDDMWSNFIRFDTNIANQRLYLINRRVKEMKATLLEPALQEDVDPETEPEIEDTQELEDENADDEEDSDDELDFIGDPDLDLEVFSGAA